MRKAIFYHAGCKVCVSAEQAVLDLVDQKKYELEVVHFGVQKSRILEAEKAGVQSVPALVLDGAVIHLNFGASMKDVKASLS